MTCHESCPILGLFAATIGVVASAAVITICSINIVYPYMMTREFHSAECLVESVEILNVTRKCRCGYEGGQCDVIHSLCVVANVRFKSDLQTRHGTLFESDQSLAFDDQCSYPTCWSYKNYYASNESYDVSGGFEDFLYTYEFGASVDCFVDSESDDHDSRVVGVKHVSRNDVIHSLAWPLSVFFLGIICSICSFKQLNT
ncbi:uncharacterized protein LOC117106717 [Anneissia japonica]|uniref:uncharacterized protein LOC117106717 n=1 Tax=Anneissia japonica TaxID=1529436 RepID=UPI001425999D|nr:uncharacterized protein LOC117106717 [Anneissia japonica]